MGDSRKTSLISSIVAAVCIVLYATALAYGAVNIIRNVRDMRALSEEECGALVDKASSAAILGFMSSGYQESLRDFLTESGTLLGIIISSPSGEYGFEKIPGSVITWNDISPRFKSAFGIPGDPYFRSLRIDGLRNVTIKIQYTLIDYYQFIRTLKNTLIIILAVLSLAVFTLLMEMAIKRKNYTTVHAAPRKAQAAPKTKPKTTGKIYREPADIPADVPPDIPPEEPFIDFSEPEIPAEDAAEMPEEMPEEEAAVVSSKNPAKEKTGADLPTGLYSKRGNVGWESYTKDRLASELYRCAASEQDLVFIVMEYYRDTISDKEYRMFADQAVSFFALRDLIFEKGNSGLTVVLPGIGVEQGIAKSEEFHLRLRNKMPDFIKTPQDLAIGLSSRSGRLLEPARLMLEAESAMNKAKEDPASPIVAFKSDPEKYRDYLNKHSTKG
ncbi:MAG: hypothetical protein LBF78_08705 [Treponema sp.]|jgi:hypothetical protein|nr:hypothetical protein [Treponema sp.]